MNESIYKEYLNKRINPSGRYYDLLRFPKYIEIETVHACNAKCSMCTINDWKRPSSPMDNSLFTRIADELCDHANDIFRVSLYRDGEPLLDPLLPERIERLKKGNIEEISISTNVSLLNKGRGKDILEAGIDLVIMSIDSLEEEVYKKIRCGLDLKDILNNALKFIKMRDQISPNTRIWMRMIRQESNQGEWKQYHDFWTSRLTSRDRVYYHNIFNWGGQLKNVKQVYESCEHGLPCVALWSLMVIFNNGDVPLCNADFNCKYPLGNIPTYSIKELWQHSPIIKKYRQQHLADQKPEISICKNCDVWDEADHTGEKISNNYLNSLKSANG